jgi:hypothetical protein
MISRDLERREGQSHVRNSLAPQRREPALTAMMAWPIRRTRFVRSTVPEPRSD